LLPAFLLAHAHVPHGSLLPAPIAIVRAVSSDKDDNEQPKPKSMTEFDYFSEDVAHGDVAHGEQSLAALQRRKQRLYMHAVLIAAVSAALGYYVWGLRETIAYHFKNEPLVNIDRADEKDPDSFPHDRLVRLGGITEARAAQVKWIRGLSWQRYYHYYHLLGTPVFIEIPAEEAKGKIEAFEEVTLEGRLIDLSKAHEYDRLLSFLEERLFMRIPERAFMLQVGVTPDGGKQAVIVLAVVLLLPIVNVALWLRAYRRLRPHKPTDGKPKV
jgi:hypothetical protein